MLKSRRVLVVIALTTLIYGVFAGHREARDDNSQSEENDCLENTLANKPCNQQPEEPSENQPVPSGKENWCRFKNGTTIPLGFTFVHTNCAMCECTMSRYIRCSQMNCLPAYCIDNSMPTRKDGQCCAQCKYEQTGTGCAYNNFTFPHGSVVKSVERKIQCWCQWGQIECRNYVGSIYDGFDLMADSTVIYIVIMILGAVLIFGLLLCCGCSFFFYRYYQRHQAEFEQTYDQYVNEAGWQPIDEAEQYSADSAAEQKQAEAEKSQLDGNTVETVPAPPYDYFGGSSSAEEQRAK